jgi:hypothetical protein
MNDGGGKGSINFAWGLGIQVQDFPLHNAAACALDFNQKSSNRSS